MRFLFINLPPASTKKSGNDLYWLQASMNLGLLAVASAASRVGHEVHVYDWLGNHQYHLLDSLPGILSNSTPDIVGLSLPSGYGEEYCAPFSETIKQVAPHARIVVGGQYHAGMRSLELLERFPLIDAVAVGDGEQIDWEHFQNCPLDDPPPGLVSRQSARVKEVPKTKAARAISPEYKFQLNRLDLRSYAPSIEIARGCPFTCSFCSLSGAPTRLERATHSVISKQLEFWVETWGKLPRIPIYFECPVFFCNKRNIDGYAACLTPFSDRIEWRTQCRVDSVEPEVLVQLHQLGLRILDLGLESASPRMLKLMEKTESPGRYLLQAQSLIDAAAACGIGVKLNILLFPGETEQTAAETEAFIHRNRGKISGIAAGSAIEFPGSSLSTQLSSFETEYGTRRRDDGRLSPAGIYPLDLSRDFPLERAREWCLRMTRSVTDAKSYYQLKRIGYFRPDFSFSDFMKVVRNAHPERLPFDLPSERSESTSPGGWDPIEWDQLR